MKMGSSAAKKTEEDYLRGSRKNGWIGSVNNRLGTKLNLIFSIGLLASVIAVVISISLYNSKAQNESFYLNCEYDMNAITLLKDDLLESTAVAADNISREKSLITAVETAYAPFVKNSLLEMMIQDSVEIAVLDNNGALIYATVPEVECVVGFHGVQMALGGEANSYCEVINDNLYAVAAAPIRSKNVGIGVVVVTSCLGTDINMDTLKKSSGGEFTVIAGNVRAATSIIDSEGIRQNGTVIADSVFQTVNVAGEKLTGTADVAGSQFIVNYEPVYGSDGTVVGSLFTGNSVEYSKRQTRDVAIFGALVGLAVFVIVDLILLRIVGKGIVRPLKRIVSFSEDVSAGNLGINAALDENYQYNDLDEIGHVFAAQRRTVDFIREYIGEISSSLSSLAEGDLKFEITREYIGDFTEIRLALEEVKKKLITSMSNINNASSVLSVSAEDIANGSQSLAQGASEQVSSIHQLNDTLDTVYTNIVQNAKNAEEASKITVEVGNSIREGNDQMEEMMQAMSEIQKASVKISNITKTIEDIAFQTNILALNAAVESARAGEAGKGFAVVADEVRNLAGKSAAAAHDTTEQIQNSLSLIEAGAQKANATAATMKKTVAIAANAVSAIENISVASAQQAEAVGLLQSGMTQIEGVVNTTSATAEESAATGQTLSSQAKLLEDLVSSFRF